MHRCCGFLLPGMTMPGDLRPGTVNYDPYQLQSRHADPAYAGVMAQLAAKLNQLRTCSGISCEVQ